MKTPTKRKDGKTRTEIQVSLAVTDEELEKIKRLAQQFRESVAMYNPKLAKLTSDRDYLAIILKKAIEDAHVEPTKQEKKQAEDALGKWSEKANEIDARVDAAVLADNRGRKALVHYFAYESDENDEPIDNLDEIAIKGKAIITLDNEPFYGGEFGEPYSSGTIENPTWLQLAVLADEAIRVTNDHHHVFFKGVDPTGKLAYGVPVYELCMGS